MKSKKDEQPNFRTLEAQAAGNSDLTYLPVRPNLSDLELTSTCLCGLSLRYVNPELDRRGQEQQRCRLRYSSSSGEMPVNIATASHRSILATARDGCLSILMALPKPSNRELPHSLYARRRAGIVITPPVQASRRENMLDANPEI